ncbi:hypothetical protein NQZ68_023692 [Dissostichus eleginoides]|nr:hypothetical protein NQZ68_023692 [Dissostichus eleginoides]
MFTHQMKSPLPVHQIETLHLKGKLSHSYELRCCNEVQTRCTWSGKRLNAPVKQKEMEDSGVGTAMSLPRIDS